MSDLQLRYFLICAQERSFTDAANRIGVSQPALSQQIRKLETNLGISLFLRAGRGIKLTAAGQKLWGQMQPLYNNVDSVIRELQFQEGVIEGTIAIAGVHSILSYLLPEVISDHAKNSPEIKFQIYTRSSQEVIQLAFNRTVDFGLVYENMALPNELDIHPIYNELLVAVFSPDAEFAGQIIQERSLPAEAPVIVFPPGYAIRSAVDKAFSDRPLNIRMEVETIDIMLNLVRHKAGVCFAPLYVAQHQPDLCFSALSGIHIELSTVMVSRHGNPPQPITQQFVERLYQFCNQSQP